MANIEKPKFQILDVSGCNYLSWCLDIELHLQGQGLVKTIEGKGDADEKNKANALIFIRSHLHDSLKAQYLSVRDPLILWTRLKEMYDHTKTVILPQAQYDWQNIRLQDFKSVFDYNSALFDIYSKLELCGIKLTDAELLEKTFSTFHASTIVLQQYRQRQFETYSQLISVLLTAEKTNELLLKNHELRPVGSKAFPEVNAGENKNIGKFKGRERIHGKSIKKDAKRSNYNIFQGNQKGKRPMKRYGESICHCCGMSGHWTRTCRTAKHLVDLYQASLKIKGKHVESHAIDDEHALNGVETNVTISKENLLAIDKEQHFDVSDFLEEYPKNDMSSEWWMNTKI